MNVVAVLLWGRLHLQTQGTLKVCVEREAAIKFQSGGAIRVGCTFLPIAETYYCSHENLDLNHES